MKRTSSEPSGSSRRGGTKTPATIRVAIADPHPIYRHGVRAALDAHPRFSVVGESSDGWSALELASATRPDVTLASWRLPKLPGPELVGELRRRADTTRLVFLADDDRAHIVHKAITSGATGFLSKRVDEKELANSLMACASNQVIISQDLQSSFNSFTREHSDKASVLSNREREILLMVADGSSAELIGRALYLSPATVRTYLRRSYEKLGVRTQAAAVAEAFRAGILE